jgi:hypothetical protein
MDALELLNDEYGHCGECHEVHYIPSMVVIDGYYYCEACSRPTPARCYRGKRKTLSNTACSGRGLRFVWLR